MRVVSFVTQKGGTGKSTLAFNVAVAAAEAGETVALFDLDPQGMVRRWGEVRYQLHQEAKKQGNTVKAAVLALPHVEHVPPPNIPTFSDQLNALQGFSLAILDTKGEDSPAQHIAMQLASLNVVVMQPTRADADMSWPTILALMDSDRPWGSALTRCLPSTTNNRAPELANDLKEFGLLLEPLIVNRVEYQDAYAVGLGVTEQNKNSKAAGEIRALWQSIDNAMKERR